MTPIRSSKLSPSVESLRSFRPRPTETSSGSATSHSIVNAIWSSASSICSSTSAPSPHVTTSFEKFPRRGAVGCRYNPPQLNTGPSFETKLSAAGPGCQGDFETLLYCIIFAEAIMSARETAELLLLVGRLVQTEGYDGELSPAQWMALRFFAP